MVQSPNSQKPKILVVDDEPDNLDLLYRTFRRDYRVLRADSGQTALDILSQEEDIAVIISDQRMPKMTGTELLSLTALYYPTMVRIILTGYTDVEDLVEAINSGKVFKYVTKPWDADELKGIVQQALDTHNLLKIQTAELSKSLRRETLLNAVMNAIRSPRYDVPDGSPLQDVLQTIVNSVGQVLEVDICILRPCEEEQLTHEWFIFHREDLTPAENLSDIALTVWQTPTVQVFHNVQTDLFFQMEGEIAEERMSAFVRSNIASTLIVPLIAQQKLMAVMALHHCQFSRLWESDEIQLAGMVADQAALAISQARAYETVRALAQRESLINTITSAIRSTLNPQSIFTAITKQLGQAMKVDGCVLSLWTKEDDYVQCVGLYDVQNEEDKEYPLPQSIVPINENPVLQELLTTLKPVVLEDMAEHSEMNRYDLPLRSSAKALLVVPLIVDGGIIGSISLRKSNQSRNWSSSDIALAQAVASQAAIAVQQARLYETTCQQAEQLRESEARVKQLNTYLTESVLKRFLPNAIVNKAATGELALDLTPEPRLVTILFSDIVGFTPLSSRLGPQRIAELLNEYLETMTRAVFDNGGTVDKFIGDAVLALFGSPEELSPEEQVGRSIRTAQAMYRSLEDLNQRWISRGIIGNNGTPTVQFRCGIHQGNAVVGMFGGGQRSDYTAIGPAVNMAARLQEAADAKHILVSATVARYLKPDDIIDVKTIRLKGIEEDVVTYSVKVEANKSNEH